MTMVYKYIRFVEMDAGARKTKIWRCESEDGFCLGEVRWYGPWRKYCFMPASESRLVFCAQCLADINAFLEQAMHEHKTLKKQRIQIPEPA